MADCSNTPTPESTANFDLDSRCFSEAMTSNADYTTARASDGGVKKTYAAALRDAGWNHTGEWSTNPEVTEANQVIPYAGTNQLFRPTSLPYQVDSAAHPDPNSLVGTDLVDVSKFTDESYVITTSGVVFDTFAAMKSSVKVFSIGTRMSTNGRFVSGDSGAASYVVVAAGTGTADNGNLIDLANGLQAKLIQSLCMSSVVFGVVGDGVADDTNAVKAAHTRGHGFTWYLNQTPKITAKIGFTNGCYMAEGSHFVYDGPNSQIAIELLTDGTPYGDITLDCNGKPVAAIIFRCNDSNAGHLTVQNMNCPLGSGNSLFGALFDGSNNTVQKIKTTDLHNTGNVNASMPQSAAFEPGADGNYIEVLQAIRSGSGMVAQDGSGINTIDKIICRQCSDNGMYIGGTAIVSLLDYDGSEEAVVASQSGEIQITKAIVRGTGLGAVNTSTGRKVQIDELVIDFNDSMQTPKQVLVTRSDNSNAGSFVIGKITGIINAVKVFALDKGTMENLVVGEIDLTVRYDPALMGATGGTLLMSDMQACRQFTMGRVKIDLYDFNGALVSSPTIFQWRGPTHVQRKSVLEEIVFNAYKTNFQTVETNGMFRGESFAVQNIEVRHASWQTNIGPYIREYSYRNGTDGLSAVPIKGYWKAGEDKALNFATSAPFRARCTVSGTPGVWVSY